MAEWRRTLRSWPKETAQVADPASLPEWARTSPSQEGPWMREVWAVVILSLFLLAVLAVVLALLLYPWLGVRGVGALFLLAGLGSQITLRRTLRDWSDRRVARRREADLDALREVGEPTLDGDYVGVTYADGLWRYPLRTEGELDMGVLRLDFDRIAFVGRGTRFALPAHAVASTEIRRHSASAGERAHLVIRWRDAGRSGIIRLAIPSGCLRTHVQETSALRDRIERWRAESYPRRGLTTEFPPTIEPRPITPTRPIGLPAKLLAVPATILLLGTIEAVMTGVASVAGWSRTGQLLSWLIMLSWAVWSVLAAVIDRRLPERYRYQAKGPSDPQEVGEAIATPEVGTNLEQRA